MYSLWGLSVTDNYGEHQQGCKVTFSHEICSKVSSILKGRGSGAKPLAGAQGALLKLEQFDHIIRHLGWVAVRPPHIIISSVLLFSPDLPWSQGWPNLDQNWLKLANPPCSIRALQLVAGELGTQLILTANTKNSRFYYPRFGTELFKNGKIISLDILDWLHRPRMIPVGCTFSVTRSLPSLHEITDERPFHYPPAWLERPPPYTLTWNPSIAFGKRSQAAPNPQAAKPSANIHIFLSCATTRRKLTTSAELRITSVNSMI